MSEEEEQRLANWLPDGPALFEHFRDLDAPLRVDNLPAYVRALGFSSDLMLTDSFQAMPMRHLGKHVGIFFLGSKQDGEGFTDEDEEVLVLFAAQAAMAIANARTHRDEQRARARPRGAGGDLARRRRGARRRDRKRAVGQPGSQTPQSAACSVRSAGWRTCEK